MKIVEINDTIEYNSEKRMTNANIADLCVDLGTVLIATVYGNKRGMAQHILRYSNLTDATVSCVTSMELFNCNVSRFLPQFMRVFENIQHFMRHLLSQTS